MARIAEPTQSPSPNFPGVSPAPLQKEREKEKDFCRLAVANHPPPCCCCSGLARLGVEPVFVKPAPGAKGSPCLIELAEPAPYQITSRRSLLPHFTSSPSHLAPPFPQTRSFHPPPPRASRSRNSGVASNSPCADALPSRRAPPVAPLSELRFFRTGPSTKPSNHERMCLLPSSKRVANG